MHLWQSVHIMIDHHHCLHMEGRGAWGGGSDRGASICRTCCVLKLKARASKSVLPRTPPPCCRRRMAIYHLIYDWQ